SDRSDVPSSLNSKMMSAPFFNRNGQGHVPARPQGQQGDHSAFTSATNAAGGSQDQVYYQMSRMNPTVSGAPFAAPHSQTSSLPFFTNPSSIHPGASSYHAATMPKVEYADRSISDEMMRHILMSANNMPASSHQPPPSSLNNVSSAMRPLHSHQTTFSNGSMGKEKDLLHGVLAGGTNKKGKKGSRKELGPGEKPARKKKRRAFEFYWEEMRGDYAKTHSHLGHNERRAIAQQEWKNVTDRDKWQKMADEYNEKMLSDKYKLRPKPPVTANAFYFKEQHVLLRQQRPELKGGAVLSEISKMWEKCTDRQRWLDMQAEDRRRYEAEMATYKNVSPI
ncbi:hypothetical protein PMAYCL1PPCAC_18226, partial [Pristionchus mayeri]